MEIGGLVQVAARHMGSYIGLVSQAAIEYRAFFLQRAFLASAALIMAIVTVMTAWATGLALLWDSPWRITYCVVSVVFCLVATILFGALAARRITSGPHGRTLRQEAAQDLQLLQEWQRST